MERMKAAEREKQNALELDYPLEAESLRAVRANLKRHGLVPGEVELPQPLPGLSTARMLVMDLLPGPKLIDGLRAYGAEYAAQQGTTLEAMEAEMKAKFEAGQMGSTAYKGPSARTIGAYRSLMRLKDWLFGTTSVLPLNAPRLIDQLMRVHGRQLLSDGLFQADPHGGNFLLLPDERIGLIDYGATKEFTRNERLSACALFAALHKRDVKMLQVRTRATRIVKRSRAALLRAHASHGERTRACPCRFATGHVRCRRLQVQVWQEGGDPQADGVWLRQLGRRRHGRQEYHPVHRRPQGGGPVV